MHRESVTLLLDEIIKRQENIENAGRWIRWLIENTHLVVLVPWWPLIAVVDDERHRSRLMVDQVYMITRCSDLLIQCGGHVSPHMQDHERVGRRRKIPVAIANLTQFGRMPPQRGATFQACMRELSRAMDEASDNAHMTGTHPIVKPDNGGNGE